jgi:hypothetical protein
MIALPSDIAGVLARQPPDWAADGRGREAAAGTAEPAKGLPRRKRGPCSRIRTRDEKGRYTR